MSVLIAARAAAQISPAASPPLPGRLTVRPHAMATGTRTAQAGDLVLDSLREFRVYVPEQCVGTRRCPLVVSLLDEQETSWSLVNLQRSLADKYGMIHLVPTTTAEDGLWDVQRAFPIARRGPDLGG